MTGAEEIGAAFADSRRRHRVLSMEDVASVIEKVHAATDEEQVAAYLAVESARDRLGHDLHGSTAAIAVHLAARKTGA